MMLRSGEIIAHRCWVRDRGVLKSPFCQALWPDNEITAQDREFGVDLSLHGRGGIYAYRTYEDLCSNVLVPEKLNWLVKQWPYSGDTLEVGTCWLWGTVVEHGNGWRARHAAVKSIDQVRYWPDFTKARHLPDFR